MLTVKALRCVNLRNVALSGSNERQDPYVTLTLEENQKLHTKTDVCYSGGTTPHWFQGNWMRLPIHQSNMTCLVQVWDKHSGDADELIASGRINLSRYDEDGAEEEPTSVDLFWQNGEPAGKFHCILSYDPPYSQVQPQDDTLTGKGDAQQQGVDESWMPWIRLKVKHKSGQVKDYVISRSRLRIDTGRDFLSTRVPQARAMVDNLVTNFRNRTVLEQAGFIALAILLIAVPYPRMFVGWTYHSVHDSLAWLWSSFYAATFGALASMFNSVWAGVRWAFSWNWAIATTVLKWTSIISLFTVVPALAVLCGPRAIGLALTKLATFMTGGHIISFGTVTFVPWITDFKRLKMRFILVDFLLGNPRDKGYTPRLASFNRVEFVGSISFADIFNAMRFNYIRTPLKDVPDYDKLALVRIDHLEIDGLSINLEVNDKNKLNLPELLSSFDRAQVNRALMKRDINPETFRFPNCLEVQVLGARNLRSMGLNGLADPFYSVRVRKQVLNSETVVKTLNPAFPPRVEQFFVDDPSAVVNVEIRDENIGRTSDFIGQWNITAKWLLMDPKNVRYIEWERLSESDRRQGWIGFWAPLVDEHFRQEGMCGEVHLRLRWVYNPALPVFRPGERKETQTPLQQLNMARREIRERLGDLEKIFDILKHFPILLDFEGAMLINDTKVSVHDVLFGRRRDEDNVVKRILTKQQEENEHRTSKKVMSLPRSVGIRETPVALDRDQLDSEMMAAQRDILSSTTTDQSKGIDPVDEVVVTSIDPSGAKLPKNLEIDVDTFAPGVRQEQLVQEGTIKGETSSSTFVEPSSLQNQQERYDESRIGLQQPMEKSDVPPPTTSDLAMKDTLESEIGTTDKLNAVYPEKLVSSAIGTNDSGYVRGDLAKMRRDLDAADADVYLGGEEDDDAAEERNEDRFDDDDREFDQDGREFVKIKTIMWRKQFMKRHGDPGINLYKFLERLVFGLIPKLSADARLQKAVAGSAFKGFFKGEMPIFSLNKEERSGAPGVSTETGTGRTSGVTGKIRSMAHSVKDQAKLVTHKITHQRQDEQVAAAAISGLDASHAQEGEEALRAERIVKGGEEEKSPEPVATTRPVHGTDADFNDSNLLIAGGLEAVWQGRHRITSLFRRWKPWHMEIKGDTVFYHRTTVAGLSTSTASDSVWYTLDLTWLADMYMTDSSRIHNNELVLKFVQDDNSLHLRLPSRVTTPTLDNWLAALRKVARVQQDRRRLGTAASMGNESESGYQTNSTSAWPGEDAQPQQRQRGSSLAVNLAVPTQALMKEQVASVDVVKPNQMESGQYQATINPNSKIDAYQVNESSGRESAPTVKPTQMGSSTKEATINPNYKVDFSDAGDRTKILNQQSPNKTSTYYSDQSYKPNEPPSYKPTSEISEEPERKQKLPLANFVEPQHPPKTVEFESQPQKTFTTPTMQTASAQTVITPNQVAQS